MHIIHGEDQKSSRDYLRSLIGQHKNEGIEPKYLNGDKLTKLELEAELLTNNLFTQDVLVIEKLLGRTRSKVKDQLIEFLVSNASSKPIILWDKKDITKPNLNKFKDIKPLIKHFKVSLSIFKFTGAVSPKNKKHSLELLHFALSDSSAIFVFSMLVRQVSNLIIALSSPNDLKGAPWQLGQLKRQADGWNIDQLTKLHGDLSEIDHKVKTGKTNLTLANHLDLIVMEL